MRVMAMRGRGVPIQMDRFLSDRLSGLGCVITLGLNVWGEMSGKGMNANEVDEHVGRRIRQRREAIGMSQARLGRHLGLTFSQVQKYEKGSNRIGAGRLYLMAHHLGVPVHYFFEGLDDGAVQRAQIGAVNLTGELSVLDDAFLSITDPGTRQSLIALVRSLAVPPAVVEAPRQRAS